MFIELNKTVGEHKAGEIIDLDESVARSYINLGFAKESDARSHVAAISCMS